MQNQTNTPFISIQLLAHTWCGKRINVLFRMNRCFGLERQEYLQAVGLISIGFGF